jgi:ABC-type ATPase with predicted acetyltransferase domain
MNGRTNEEFHVTCYRCHCSVHIACSARPECPKCLQRLTIQWRAPIETPRYANVTEGGGRLNLYRLRLRDRTQP